MNQFLFKPENYEKWSKSTIDKIIKTIESCETEPHLDTAKNMIDNFVLMMAINGNYKDEQVQDISKQLYLCLNLKRCSL